MTDRQRTEDRGHSCVEKALLALKMRMLRGIDFPYMNKFGIFQVIRSPNSQKIETKIKIDVDLTMFPIPQMGQLHLIIPWLDLHLKLIGLSSKTAHHVIIYYD